MRGCSETGNSSNLFGYYECTAKSYYCSIKVNIIKMNYEKDCWCTSRVWSERNGKFRPALRMSRQ